MNHEDYTGEMLPARYAPYRNVIREIDRICAEKDGQILIAIDGQSASGKTTLGELLKEWYDCNLFHMDDFFLRMEQRTEERMREVGGNVDYERFRLEVLDHIGDLGGLTYQLFSCSRMALDAYVTVLWKRINIIEGAYSQHPYFGDIYDLRFYYGIDPEEQIARIRKRNGEEKLVRFINEWIPKENAYLETFHIREKSKKVELL
jgi:uridine kinase